MTDDGFSAGRVPEKLDETFRVNFECSPGDVSASLLFSRGIDHSLNYQTNARRPVKLVADARHQEVACLT